MEILSSQVIHKNPGRYVAWPMISKTAMGELLVVFSGDREGHVCPYGKTFLMRSPDDGQSQNWSMTRRWTIAMRVCVCAQTAR